MKLLEPLLTPARWACLAGLLLAGCARPEEPLPPPNLLPKQVVISVLIEVHLLEARIESSRLSPDSARALFQSQERDLLWKHNLTEADSSFQRSYRYYAVHDKDLEEMYKVVIDSLMVRDKLAGGTPEAQRY